MVVIQRVTIYDVAQEAEVSVSTASKALNGKGRMSDDTRLKIANTARQLGYHNRRSSLSIATVGLLTLDGYGRFTPKILAGVEDGLSAEEWTMVTCDARRDPVRLRHYVSRLVERRVDGIIVTGRATDPVEPISKSLPFPVVYAYRRCVAAVPQVSVDDTQGGRLVARQLVRDGRTRVLVLAGPPEVLAARERLQGINAVIERSDLTVAAVTHSPFSEHAGYTAVLDAVDSGLDFDAVYGANDQLARGAADALVELGRKIPDDVAVIGFDNWTLLAAATRPPLTSIDMNLYKLGRRTAELLVSQLHGDRTPVNELLPCSIAVRQSCPAATESDPQWTSDTPMIPDA